MLKASINTDQADQFLAALLTGLPGRQQKAMHAAVAGVNAQLINSIAQDSGIPVSIAARRVKTSVTPAVGKVWIGAAPVSTAFLQPLRQTGSGATAGELYFEGGFIVSKYRGRSYLAKRMFRKRSPIMQLVAPMIIARTINSGVIDTSADTYIDAFMENIE